MTSKKCRFFIAQDGIGAKAKGPHTVRTLCLDAFSANDYTQV